MSQSGIADPQIAVEKGTDFLKDKLEEIAEGWFECVNSMHITVWIPNFHSCSRNSFRKSRLSSAPAGSAQTDWQLGKSPRTT